jgi:hypothetical protein
MRQVAPILDSWTVSSRSSKSSSKPHAPGTVFWGFGLRSLGRIGLGIALAACSGNGALPANGTGGANSESVGGTQNFATGTGSGGALQGKTTAGPVGGSTSGGSGRSTGSGAAGAVSGNGGNLPGTGACGAQPGQLFGADYPWNQRIDQATLDSESAAIVAYLQSNHTAGARFRIDGPSEEANSLYGITLLNADPSTPHQSFTQSDDFFSPDCDPAPIPIPAGGAIEGETSYACANDGDCHLIAIDRTQCRLFEMWRANRSSASSFQGGCQAIWDLRAPYSPTLRGDCCTSADAAGLPIAAHMFTADDIAAGEIPHAIRFILPNSLIRSRIYVRPATHSTDATSGSASAPPYGARMRLKAGFDTSKLTAGARVVARALKEYGMILSDGGNLTFTAANDRFTDHKWREVELSPGDLTGIAWSDFEVPTLGTRYEWNDQCDCRRTPVSQ